LTFKLLQLLLLLLLLMMMMMTRNSKLRGFANGAL
jgi:hypothetical protein